MPEPGEPKNEDVFEDGEGGKWVEGPDGVLEFKKKVDPMADAAEMEVSSPRAEYNDLLLKRKRTPYEQKKLEALYYEITGKKYKG